MWAIEFDPGTRVLTLRLTQHVGGMHLRALARAHQNALAATGGEPFRVLVDLRGLMPLDAEAALQLAELKRNGAAPSTFRGRIVLCDSATVAMQQRRTGLEDGTASQEVITLDEREALLLLRSG